METPYRIENIKILYHILIFYANFLLDMVDIKFSEKNPRIIST